MSSMNWDEVAASAYRAYAASTGNKNFQGNPMPDFAALSRPIQLAWECAVRQAVAVQENPNAVLEEGRWSKWTADILEAEKPPEPVVADPPKTPVAPKTHAKPAPVLPKPAAPVVPAKPDEPKV